MCEYTKDEYIISTERDRLDFEVIHEFLRHSYWCPGIPIQVLQKAISHSLCFGLYEGQSQIGFARVVTDYARFAYLCDLFVLKSHRGKGLGIWLTECVVNCPLLDGIRVMSLGTSDAHGLYEKFGFRVVENSGELMQLKFDMPWHRPDMVEE